MASLAKASIRLGKALAPAKPARLTFEIVRKQLAARGITIRANDWGEYRVNYKGGKDETACYVSRSHDQQETLAEALAEGNALADFADRAAKAGRVPPLAARLESAFPAERTARVVATARRYRLGSNGLVHAPGIIAWAINGYAFKKDRKAIENVVVSGWNVPVEHARALLSKAVPYRVEDETVVFEVPA